jgi:site-specific DNA recombinase
MKRAAIYARVSTARQEQEQTMGSQLHAIEDAALGLGLSVARERTYVDDGFSGSRLDRPGLDALRDAAAEGLLDVVIVYCPDRLARNYVHQQVVLEELSKRGVEVHFVEHPVGERAEDRLLVQMQGVIAEYERAKILERTRRGRIHKIRSGVTLPFSANAPYGYGIVRGDDGRRVVVVDEVQAQVVREAYRACVEDGLSARQIAKRLLASQVPAPRGRRWQSSSVYRMLTNPAYTGVAAYGRREAIEPKRPREPGKYRRSLKSSTRARPMAQWLRVAIPAIVDEATQAAARAQLKANKLVGPGRTTHEYLLRSLVVCGDCKCRMQSAAQATTQKNKTYRYFYYACGRRTLDTGREHPCPARRIRASEIDAVVWQAICSWIETPEMLQEEVEAWRAVSTNAAEGSRERVALEKAHRSLQHQSDRLVDAYQQGAIKIDELKSRREHLSTAIDLNTSRLQAIEARAMDAARVNQLAENIADFATTLRSGMHTLDFAGRQRLVRLLIERVLVTGDDIAIEHAIPLRGRFSVSRSHHHRP